MYTLKRKDKFIKKFMASHPILHYFTILKLICIVICRMPYNICNLVKLSLFILFYCYYATIIIIIQNNVD